MGENERQPERGNAARCHEESAKQQPSLREAIRPDRFSHDHNYVPSRPKGNIFLQTCLAGSISVYKSKMLKTAVLAISTMLVAPMLTLGSVPASATALGPQLSVISPTHVDVGQPIEIEVSLSDAPTVAGFEASVRYDEAAAEFGGVLFGGATSSGNVVSRVTTGPAGGAAFAAYTCVTSGCPAPNAAAARNALEHVTVRIEPTMAGHLIVTLNPMKFVDLQGNSVDVNVPVHSVTIDVGAASSSSTFAPTSVATVLPRDNGATHPSLDVDGNGAVNSADVNDLAASWSDARRFDACTVAGATDPNGDGCLDVADLQLIAGSPAVAPAAGPATSTAGPTGISQALSAPLVVNTTNDLPDSNIGNGRCVTANGDCSLRAAIHEANASAGPDTIQFNIPGAGVHTIQLGNTLPTITDGGLTIDGYTQPGSQKNTDPLISNAAIMIEVKGLGSSLTDPATGFDAFKIVSANNRIQGLAIYNVFNHFEISGSGATGNVIAGNFIGSDAGSTFVAPPRTEGGIGITMISGANHNIVGTSALADRNVIGGTPGTALRIQHEGTNNNTVQNNLFGLKPHGDAGLPLGFNGVDIQFGAKNNLVGGPGPQERNVIAGAGAANAIDLSHQVDTTGNRVINNFIGTTPAGNAVAPIQNLRGVAFKDGIEDNFVTGNVIGGSKNDGLWVRFDFNGRNFVSGNRVGIALDGTAIPNALHGMFVQGHDFQVSGNVFANNAQGGILVTFEAGHVPNTTVRNRLSGNTFGPNGGLAIDLAPVGPTANDVGDADVGPNELLNYPTLAATQSTTIVTGTVCGSCRVEIYKAVADSSGRGVGQKLVGIANAAGDGSFIASTAGLAVGDNVAAITIDGVGNTSEFSPLSPVTVVGPQPPQPPTTSTSSFVSLQPARLLETRSGLPTVDGLFQGGGLVGRGGVVELTVANRGGVPIDAESVALNVTVTEAVGAGFVTVYPCGSQQPLASSLNYIAGQTVPNAVISRVGAGGAVCLFVSEGTHLVADVTGYFPPGSSFNSLLPARLLETRTGPGLATVDGLFNGAGPVARDTTLQLQVAGRGEVPADATAVVLNVTVTQPVGAGFVTVYPCGDARPLASNLNFVAGQTVPNQVISKVGAGGQVCLYSNETTHMVADIGGYFGPDSTYVSLLPARLLETRAGPGFATVDGAFFGGGLVPRGGTVQLQVTNRGGVPANAGTVVLNVTATQAAGAGFVTVYPCGETQPVASSLNYVSGQSVPNSVLAKVGAGGTVCLFVSEATNLVADVDGYFPPSV